MADMCSLLMITGALRIPVVSVQHFPDLVAALNASYEAYDLALSQQQHHIHSLFQASLWSIFVLLHFHLALEVKQNVSKYLK